MQVTSEDLVLDSRRRGVEVDGKFVPLSRTEYRLLELLCANRARVLATPDIYEQVWDFDPGPAANGLRVYIGYLRQKLGDAGAPGLIHTVRGVGYVLA